VRQVVDDLVAWLSKPEQAGLRRIFAAWIRQAVLPARLGGIPVPAVSELSEVREMLQQRVIEWTRQWKQEGWDEGRDEGRAEGRRALIRLIERRFGTLTSEQRAHVEAADLEVLADRLLEARSFEELFDQ
jgi:hypothetical protein